jgi:hypothetical protein
VLAAQRSLVSAAMQHSEGGGGAGGRVTVTGTGRKQFFVEIFFEIFFRKIANPTETYYRASMTFYSLPFTPERVEATEARLEAIYEAAKYGLKGDSLAMRAGLTPAQYRRLQEFDPLVEMAELKGRADGEWMAAKTLHEAAAEGDAKAALDILKHQHGWVAKQQVDINVDQQISVIGALERAQTRVIEGLYTELPQLEDNTNAAADLLRPRRNGVDVEAVVPDD